MTREFVNLAAGLDLQGRWREPRPVSGSMYQELEFGEHNLPRQLVNTDISEGRDLTIHLKFGCDEFRSFPLAEGQRNQAPVQGWFPLLSFGGGPGNQGRFKELTSIRWHDQKLCLVYNLGRAMHEQEGSLGAYKTFCFEYQESDGSIEMSAYAPSPSDPNSLPEPSGTPVRYYRVEANDSARDVHPSTSGVTARAK